MKVGVVGATGQVGAVMRSDPEEDREDHEQPEEDPRVPLVREPPPRRRHGLLPNTDGVRNAIGRRPRGVVVVLRASLW